MFAAVPFIQLGYSYYLSVQMVMFSVLAMLSLGKISKRAAKLMLLGGLGFIAKVALLISSYSDIQDALFVMREFSCYIAMLGIAELARRQLIDRQRLFNLSLGFIVILLIVSSVQYVAILRGTYITFPVSWFIMNDVTLIGQELFLEHGGLPRPVAFYGEPSYAAFVCLCCLMICLSASNGASFLARFASANALVTTVVLHAFSGLVSIVTLYVAWELAKIAKLRHVASVALVFLALILSFAIFTQFSPTFSERFHSILTGSDLSTNTRIDKPINLLEDLWGKAKFFGVTPNYIRIWNEGELLDNAFFQIVAIYGVFAITFVITMGLYGRYPTVILFLLLCLAFNGAFFRFDKAVLIGCVIGISLNMIETRNNQMNRKVVG